MRSFLLLLLLLAGASSWANDALVLISPENAGPAVDERAIVHGEWILWPAATDGNRLLSLLSGLDWQGTGHELEFTAGPGGSLSTDFKGLSATGYFTARARIVDRPTVALESHGQSAGPLAMLLSLDGHSPAPEIVPLGGKWPSDALVVAQANTWDQVAEIVQRARGRVLVIEYPPPAGKRWSQAWLQGANWPRGLATWSAFDVPGLIPASEVGNLLLHPDTFDWRPNDTANRGGANRWIAFVSYASPLTLSILGFSSIFFAGCAVYLISKEDHARVAGTVLKYLLLLPATVIMAGSLTRQLGYDGVILWLAGTYGVLVFASLVLGGIFRQAFPRAHPLLGISLVGFMATVASSPLWSMYSNVLNPNVLPIAPEAAGAVVGYLTAICAFSRGAGSAAWMARGLAVLTLAWGVAVPTWWVSGQWPFALLPLVALIAGEGWFRLWMLPVFAAAPALNTGALRHGFVWAPGNLYSNLSQLGGINLARDAEFFTSFGFVSAALIVGALALFVEKYFFHEIRRTLIRDSRVKGLFFASYACGAMGILQPLMLYPALVCFVGGLFVLLSDAARAA